MKIHNELDDDEKFKCNERLLLYIIMHVYVIHRKTKLSYLSNYSSTSAHNRVVQQELLQQVTDQPNCKYLNEVVKGSLLIK